MGHTRVEIELSDMERKKTAKVKAMVDTGATLTVLPENIANDLGIEPTTEERVMTGARPIEVKRGRGWTKLNGKEDAFPLWISDFIDKVLLGVVVLVSLGFEVDPMTEKSKERPLLLY